MEDRYWEAEEHVQMERGIRGGGEWREKRKKNGNKDFVNGEGKKSWKKAAMGKKRRYIMYKYKFPMMNVINMYDKYVLIKK